MISISPYYRQLYIQLLGKYVLRESDVPVAFYGTSSYETHKKSIDEMITRSLDISNSFCETSGDTSGGPNEIIDIIDITKISRGSPRVEIVKCVERVENIKRLCEYFDYNTLFASACSCANVILVNVLLDIYGQSVFSFSALWGILTAKKFTNNHHTILITIRDKILKYFSHTITGTIQHLIMNNDKEPNFKIVYETLYRS